MKASIHLLALAMAGLLAGCAAQHGGVNDTSYVPESGGPGYGVGTNTNAVPGARPPAAGGAQGSSGTGVSNSGTAGAYGTGESGSAAQSTGAANPNATGGGNASSQGGSAAGATGSGAHRQAMCALQQRLKAARTEEERQAILDQAMPGMTPDLRQQELQAMREECP